VRLFKIGPKWHYAYHFDGSTSSLHTKELKTQVGGKVATTEAGDTVYAFRFGKLFYAMTVNSWAIDTGMAYQLVPDDLFYLAFDQLFDESYELQERKDGRWSLQEIKFGDPSPDPEKAALSEIHDDKREVLDMFRDDVVVDPVLRVIDGLEREKRTYSRKWD